MIRQYNGIFTDRVKNFTLKNVKQHFAYGLALVCQNTENITIDGAVFAPEEGSVLHTAACADFMHLCMCKGDIKITNSLFEGAGDDCLNVHGIHFKITKMDGNKLTVRLMHPQAHGFNPLNVGDKIEYVDPQTLLPSGEAQIKSSKLLNEYEIELEIDNTQGAEEGLVIEDVTLCPNVYFADNTINRIVTRGLLLTTRGKIVVENNHFKDNEMDGILFSDDAKSWYESGRVFDATIRGNRFDYCGSYYVEILPENGQTGTIVHENFLIEDNDFNSSRAGGINAKGTRHLIIRNNRFKNPKTSFLKTSTVEKIESDL